MSMKNTAACTIVSKNYFGYARTVMESLGRQDPDLSRFILVVDEDRGREQFTCAGVEVVFLADLRIPDWRKAAFRFDVMELNTNVKPAMFQWLLDKGFEFAFYFDPDIYLFHSIDVLVAGLAEANILVTPHALSPVNESDGKRPIDRDFLRCGVYNLGFMGIRNSPETRRFLRWWSERCLSSGFNELSVGLFVDQCWIDLVPCYFEGVHIWRHPGCNVAYWNLHERELVAGTGSREPAIAAGGSSYPLVFFHFSGFNLHDPEHLSKHQNRFRLSDRPDIRRLFEEYRDRLVANGQVEYAKQEYSFARFQDGRRISGVLRRSYAGLAQLSNEADPFSVSSAIYRFAQENRLLLPEGGTVPHAGVNSMSAEVQTDGRLRMAGAGMRWALRILGPGRFETLCRFMRFYGVVNNNIRLMFPDQGRR